MNVSEGQMFIIVYRYPSNYPISSTLPLITQFLRYCGIFILLHFINGVHAMNN